MVYLPKHLVNTAGNHSSHLHKLYLASRPENCSNPLMNFWYKYHFAFTRIVLHPRPSVNLSCLVSESQHRNGARAWICDLGWQACTEVYLRIVQNGPTHDMEVCTLARSFLTYFAWSNLQNSSKLASIIGTPAETKTGERWKYESAACSSWNCVITFSWI